MATFRSWGAGAFVAVCFAACALPEGGLGLAGQALRTQGPALGSTVSPGHAVATRLAIARRLPAVAEENAPAQGRGAAPAEIASMARGTRAASSSSPGASEAPEHAKSPELVVLAGGDVNLGRDVGQRILTDPRYDPFAGVEAWFERADLVFANLESTLSEQGGQTRHPREQMAFTGPPDGADLLAQAGVTLVSVANNHAWDYGQAGFIDTLHNLSRASVAFAGGSAGERPPDEPAVLSVGGWSVAVIAVTAVWNPGALESHPARRFVAHADLDGVIARVEAARRRHDVVLVSYHGGREYHLRPSVDALVFVRRLMKAGADAVLGHHPHLSQAVAWYDGRPAFYSLGNLVFGVHRHYPWTGRGFMARIAFRTAHAPRVALCPYVLVDERPTPAVATEVDDWQSLFVSRWQAQAVGVPHADTWFGPADGDGCIPIRPMGDPASERPRSTRVPEAEVGMRAPPTGHEPGPSTGRVGRSVLGMAPEVHGAP